MLLKIKLASVAVLAYGEDHGNGDDNGAVVDDVGAIDVDDASVTLELLNRIADAVPALDVSEASNYQHAALSMNVTGDGDDDDAL